MSETETSLSPASDGAPTKAKPAAKPRARRTKTATAGETPAKKTATKSKTARAKKTANPEKAAAETSEESAKPKRRVARKKADATAAAPEAPAATAVSSVPASGPGQAITAPHDPVAQNDAPRQQSGGSDPEARGGDAPSAGRPDNRDDRGFRGRKFRRNFRNGRRRRHGDWHDREPRDESGADDEFRDSGQTFEEPAEPVFAEGVVEVSGKGFGFLRESKHDYTQTNNDVFVTPEVIRGYGLRDGIYIRGQTRRGNRGLQLYKLTEIEGKPPGEFARLPVFEELTTINPIEQIKLETEASRFTTRVIDLMAPIGKGQRGLIVAPPRTGKTTLLQHIAEAVVAKHPDIKLIILLVDERPEEVTEIRRTIPSAELMASSNDSDIKSHTRIAQLAIERARRLVEMGHDVFMLLDSITRVGRAFNNAQSGGGRTMSGGVDSRALEIPRRLFASARNTEEAGSLTIVATALIETGSRMDELIFQEFKGTGNMELVLDRKISDQRIYPAVDIFLSGTRREELLIPADDLHKISVIRRGLAGHKPIEAIERLLFFMRKYSSNEEMLRNIPG